MVTINITIPAYNEAVILKDNILKLADFCLQNLIDEWFLVVVNNHSTDATSQICGGLNKQNPKIHCLDLTQKGKGWAIKKGWEKFPADYYIFMDTDLATNLEALPRLIEELKKGNNVVIGSRTLKESNTQRSSKRKLIAWVLRTVIRSLLNLNLTDFACGFKGINQKIKEQIVPLTKDTEWFWDTELLYLTNKNGLKIKEIPVQWTETPDNKRKNKLNIFSVSLKYLRSILILRITGR